MHQFNEQPEWSQVSTISIYTWENLRVNERTPESTVRLFWLDCDLLWNPAAAFSFLSFSSKFQMSETLDMDVKKLRKKVKGVHWFNFPLKILPFSKQKGYRWDLLFHLWPCKGLLSFFFSLKKGNTKIFRTMVKISFFFTFFFSTGLLYISALYLFLALKHWGISPLCYEAPLGLWYLCFPSMKQKHYLQKLPLWWAATALSKGNAYVPTAPELQEKHKNHTRKEDETPIA